MKSLSIGALVFLLLAFASPIFALVFILLCHLHSRHHDAVAGDNIDVVIVGAGLSGINKGKKLQDIGVSRYTILQQGPGVWGTWFWNKFPGAASYIAVKLYSFSWLYNPAWTKKFPHSDELQVRVRSFITAGNAVVYSNY